MWLHRFDIFLQVLLLVNRRFAMAQGTLSERRRIGLCLSNMYDVE